MTLNEMSRGYREEAARLKERIGTLRMREKLAEPEEREKLKGRIADLLILLRQTRELAEITEHYYERGYHRNEAYTL